MPHLIGLSPVVSIGLSLVLLLGAGVMVRYVFDLVREAKTLTVVVKRAKDRLQDAALEARIEADEARERFEKLGRKQDRRRPTAKP